MQDERLTPVQQDVFDRLGSVDRPQFDPGFKDELRHELNHHLVPLAAELEEDLFVSKRQLAMVHGCEARYLAPDDFAWSVPTARGTISHKAIELLWGWRGQTESLQLVNGAIERLEAEDRSIGLFLTALDEASRADLVSQVNTHVSAFMETFPPIDPRWRPVSESRVRLELAEGRIIFAGKVDLTLGYARGAEAGKVLIDLKTGGTKPEHIADLRFYAVLETCKVGTPPRLLANFHTDQGQLQTEVVSEDLLASAVRRMTDAVEKMVELANLDRAPLRTPGRNCRYCPLLEECDVGLTHIAELDELS